MPEITREHFTKAVGHPPADDDLERANCPDAGKVGHWLCGWDEARDLPRYAVPIRAMGALHHPLWILHGKTPVPCSDPKVWAAFMEAGQQRVAWTEITRGCYVSTVFLGVAVYDWLPGGYRQRPCLFETALLREDGCATETVYGARYRTWEEAVAGHAAAVRAVTAPPTTASGAVNADEDHNGRDQ